MKKEDLTAQGLTDEQVAFVMAENGKDVKREQDKTAAMTGERDTLKTQLDEVQEKLKGFDGVDIDGLKGQIKKLTDDMSAKEADFKAQLAERDFQTAVSEAITVAKGKNAKAIASLLNTDTLKASKNQKADITAAVEALRKSDAYMFEDAGTKPPTPARISTGGAHNTDGNDGKTTTNSIMNALISGKTRGEQTNGND